MNLYGLVKEANGMTEERLLTIEQAAERLQIGRTFAYGLIQRGELASIKLGRARRVPARAIDEYVERLTADQIPAGSAGR